MSVRLGIGDVVLLNPTINTRGIGLIKYVGPMVDHDVMSEYLGVELLEPIPNGHNGTIDGFTYFTASKRHGFHTKISNIIKKLSTSDIFHQMKQIYTLLQRQSKHISLLETAKEQSATPPRIDTTLPSLTPTTLSNRSIESRQSLQSVQSQFISPAPSATSSYKISYNKASNTRINTIHNKLNKLRRRGSTSSKPWSASSSNTSAESVLEIKHRKKHRKRSSKQKRRKQLVITKTKTRSQSNSSLHSVKHRYPIHRERSNTTDLNYHLFGNTLYTNKGNIRRSPIIQQRSINDYVPMKTMSIPRQHHVSRSAPSSPYNGPIAAPYNGQYLEAKSGQYLDPNTAMNNMALSQSNTQLYGDDADIHYNVPYSTPSSPSIGNVLVVNGGYSPYSPQSYEQQRVGRNSNRSVSSYRNRSASPYNKNRSISPYRAQLIQYNEYMSTSPILQVQNHQNNNISTKVYQIHRNGMLYEHGNHINNKQ